MNSNTTARPRQSLVGLLGNSQTESLANAWNTTDAADDLASMPPGDYEAHVVAGELTTSRRGTPSYKLRVRIADGDHAGRTLWHDIWLTPAALPMAKRDLGKLGITSIDQLERPLPPGIRVALRVALRTGDDGRQYNEIRRFDFVRVDVPEADPFAPADAAPPPLGDAAEPEGPVDTSFNPETF